MISTAPAFLCVALLEVDEHNYAYVLAGAGTSFGLLWLACIRVFRHPLWAEAGNLRRRARAPEK